MFSCGQSGSENKMGAVHYRTQGGGLQKEVFDAHGRLLSRQNLDKDTIPFGALEEFYTNGKLAKWKWFNRSSVSKSGDSIAFYTYGEEDPIIREKRKDEDIQLYPDCIAYYDTSGQLDTFVGKPFIAVRFDTFGKTWVNIVNPPNTNVKLVYIDEINGKVIRSAFYNPIYCSDTGCWVGLDKYESEQGHKYELDYFFADIHNEPLFLIKGRLK